MNSSRMTAPFVISLFALLLSSCRSDGPALHPVSGKVLLNGQPTAGATVVFIPIGNAISSTPSGVTGDDGRFRLSTHPHGQGAPAGEYSVVVTKFPPDARSHANPVNQLPLKYAQVSTSGLKRTVNAGKNEVDPIELTGQGGK